ncbi:Similar to Crk: Adapter molecule Crk (Drosophila melanogaster) [Cotesia congregata]|uniref:Similar to Crk: Adapter molecule Crk (Drosophila melanogaster) n=1 Tax=Cotesia congregata TaxID=51543 RepID=A0A8J2MPT0_COTCN|nr:Similar to Crk: Adapter molecule Crk (Drosophila melanogaster) [Cotesia congregata]
MAATFDQYDKSSWYFGAMSRQDASDLLMGEKEGGVFLVRDSTSIHGDFVLCVREDSKVSHYIINKIQQADQILYRIGDQIFPDIPNLLAFYKLHYLDTTPLIRPAPKKLQKVIAKYDFEGNDQDDLPFRKGEILTIISKDEEQWWTAKNNVGQKGSIPVPYVQKYEEENPANAVDSAVSGVQEIGSGGGSTSNSINLSSQAILQQAPVSQDSPVVTTTQQQQVTRRSNIQRTLPAFAKVKQARVPNAYDKTALKLEVGDIIKVTKTNINGQWEGELHGKTGHFPFTHVEFVENEPNEESKDV